LAYFVMIVPKQEQYIESLAISDQAKLLIAKFISGAIGGVSDEIREAKRPNPEKPYFQMRLDFRDWWGDNLDHVVDFVVKDDRAAVGVLELVWVDFQ
jgi:hypothetical protein